jgi:hypothetical protein
VEAAGHEKERLLYVNLAFHEIFLGRGLKKHTIA